MHEDFVQRMDDCSGLYDKSRHLGYPYYESFSVFLVVVGSASAFKDIRRAPVMGDVDVEAEG